MIERARTRRAALVVVRALAIVCGAAVGALIATLIGRHLWHGPDTSFDTAFDRLGREWLIGGAAGALAGVALAFSVGRRRDHAGTRLADTALAIGMLLALWIGALMD
ncbi:hypothetical protein [Sphingomonas sp.]|uniref:hypothetical protein n=1 Tax=Sphingomonas sp. TaxID=28214 RepID=UPI003AFF8E28